MGTRLSEETTRRPSRWWRSAVGPILWHILKMYSHYGVNDFVICCGYKGYMIKEYFANYFLHSSDVTFDMRDEHDGGARRSAPSRGAVTLVDTGETR